MFKLGAKRRRTKLEIEQEREEERRIREGVDNRAQQIAELQARLAQVEEEKRNNDAASEILHRWREEGRVRPGAQGGVEIIEESERQSFAASQINSNHPNASLHRPTVPAGWNPAQSQMNREQQQQEDDEDIDNM